jgi:RNA-splicing ligase RtcB
MSRGEAMRTLDQQKVNERYRRDGILVNLDGEVPLDESSHCYKSADDVVSAGRRTTEASRPRGVGELPHHHAEKRTLAAERAP